MCSPGIKQEQKYSFPPSSPKHNLSVCPCFSRCISTSVRDGRLVCPGLWPIASNLESNAHCTPQYLLCKEDN